jgi:Family of unknown function (DUF6183)
VKTLDEAAAQGDLDELIRHVNRLCDERDWDELVRLRDKAKAAIERGFQLWPAASWAEYRLALEAPGEWAARMLVEGAGWMSLGPLHEVAASTHTWDELAPHHPGGAHSHLAAHERVLRGEDLTGRLDDLPQVFDVPAVLQPWEPAYALATYKEDKAEFPPPPAPEPLPTLFGDPGARVEDPAVVRALTEVVKTWTDESNGRAEIVAVEGDAPSAVAALGLRAGRAVEIEAPEALAHLAWAAASGGAHGRRRGSATGRARAWWALTTLAGLDEADTVHPDDLAEAADELTWLWWDANEPETGWSLRLAVADEADNLAWAITAQDQTTT